MKKNIKKILTFVGAGLHIGQYLLQVIAGWFQLPAGVRNEAVRLLHG